MKYKKELLRAVDVYCEATGRAKSGIGLAVLNDAKFFERFESGASCTMDTYERIMTWLKENTPKIKHVAAVNGNADHVKV